MQSLVSPLEVKVREPAVCTTCDTKECIRGSAVAPGCGLDLFQPRKHGNLDCTFCLDCVHACPHENVGVLAAFPGRTLWTRSIPLGHRPIQPAAGSGCARARAGLRRFANAAGMIEPVVKWQDQLWIATGKAVPIIRYDHCVTSLQLWCCRSWPLDVAAAFSRCWGKLTDGWLAVAMRYSFALVPIGFGMWLAHYSFHLFTSYDTIIPATQRFAEDHGWNVLAHRSCSARAAGSLPIGFRTLKS